MNKNKIIKELVILILTILPIIFLLLNWNFLPDQMPTHFDFSGEPNGYGSKYVYLILPIGLYLLLLVLPVIDPRKKNYEIFSDTYFKLRIILSVLIGGIDTVVIYNTLHDNNRLGSSLPTFILLLFTLMGNYMGTIRPNYFVGIKVPWTLNSDIVWTRTHKFAGKLWFWSGIIGAGASLIVRNPMTIMIPILIIIVVVPIVYSYFIYQNIKDQL